MTRAPGPAGDDPEPEGGRAAERLRQMMLERFGTPTRPGPPGTADADAADEDGPADAEAGDVPGAPPRVEHPAAAGDQDERQVP